MLTEGGNRIQVGLLDLDELGSNGGAEFSKDMWKKD